MTNYPTIDTSRTPWTEEDEVIEYLKCQVTGDLYQESELILDQYTGNWFHKSKVAEYVDMQAKECGWNEEEVQGALKEFTQ